jgi:3-dehydroquinate synthase
MMAVEVSVALGWIGSAELARVERLFVRAGLPVFGPALGVERYVELMQHDKKVVNGNLRLVLLKQLGQAVVSDVASQAEIARAIATRSAHV